MSALIPAYPVKRKMIYEDDSDDDDLIYEETDIDNVGPMDRFSRPDPGKYYVYQPPTVDMEIGEVKSHQILYPDYPDGTYVISGPIGDAAWPGRRFASDAAAERWVIDTYGRHYGRVKELEETAPGEFQDRWARRVKPLR